MTTDGTDLQQALAELTERVERLEAAATTPPARDAHPTPDNTQFWALNGLQSRLDEHPATAQGAVMLVGSVTLPDGGPVAWQQSAGTAGMFETDWSDAAAAFSALGHPVRLELLRHLLSGVHTTADLQEIASLGTTGQLHHHLRQLVAAGWVKQTGRGTYEVPAARVVPLLTSLIGAQR